MRKSLRFITARRYPSSGWMRKIIVSVYTVCMWYVSERVAVSGSSSLAHLGQECVRCESHCLRVPRSRSSARAWQTSPTGRWRAHRRVWVYYAININYGDRRESDRDNGACAYTQPKLNKNTPHPSAPYRIQMYALRDVYLFSRPRAQYRFTSKLPLWNSTARSLEMKTRTAPAAAEQQPASLAYHLATIRPGGIYAPAARTYNLCILWQPENCPGNTTTARRPICILSI